MARNHIKRATDLQLISAWVTPGSSVIDIGCGRGILLEHLQRTQSVWGVGVDTDLGKVQSCVKRGVNVYQGDAVNFLKELPKPFCDWVIFSRTLQELDHPAEVIEMALQVGKSVAVGFANFGYWENRISLLKTGHRLKNDVFPKEWEASGLYNPVSILEFEVFCQREGIEIKDKIYLRGDWSRQCKIFPNFMAGYALYHLQRGAVE